MTGLGVRLAVLGTVVLDTIRTPGWTAADTLGGAATYAGISASFFARTGLVAVAGSDLARRHRRMLASRMDLRGLDVREGRTFRYECRYGRTLSTRESLRVDLNVAGGARPPVPDGLRGARYVYLATGDPAHAREALSEFDGARFSMCDTIDYWIENSRGDLVRLFREVDAVILNDEEARMLAGETGLVRCARKMMRQWGIEYVIIKKGEHGSLLFHGDEVFPAAGYPLDKPVDPTGAGDAFAGGLIGRLAGRGGRVSAAAVRNAAAHGNVMGSFAVEGRGTRGLDRLAMADIGERVRRYREMTRF